MTKFLFRWGLVLMVMKGVLVVMDRFWVSDTTQEVFFCDTYREKLIYTNNFGTLYWTVFTL